MKKLHPIAKYVIISLFFSIGVAIWGVFFVIVPSKQCAANITMARQEIAAIDRAVSSYFFEIHAYPSGNINDICSQLEGDNPKEIVFYIFKKDPWGMPYILKTSANDEKPFFYSSGPDQIDDMCRSDSDDVYKTKRHTQRD